jgi:hypothetical protein
MRLPVLLLLSTLAAAADSYSVSAVTAPDRVAIEYKGLVVSLPLAHLALPADAAQRDALQGRLAALLKGQRVELVALPDFGRAEDGAQRVQMITAKGNINELLVSEGLAAFASAGKPDSSPEAMIRRAEQKAKKAQAGQWGQTVVVAAADPARPSNMTSSGQPQPVIGKGQDKAPPAAARFVSELNSVHYVAVGSPDAADIPANRAVYYTDEASAKKAGKAPKPAAAKAGPRTEAAADALFASGKAIYAEAIAAGNTTARDDLYAKANVDLSAAVAIYSALAEAKPDDEKLGEKLRECNQLRYGSIKQRRFSH